MQQLIGGMLHYTCTVDCIVVVALSSIASKHSQATEGMEKRAQQLLDRLTIQPGATVCYYASEMVLNIHLGASYLSEA